MKLGTVTTWGSFVAAIVVGTVAVVNFFETKEAAAQSHVELQIENSIAQINSDLGLVKLEREFLLKVQRDRALDVAEVDRLEYLRMRQGQLETRLLELASK